MYRSSRLTSNKEIGLSLLAKGKGLLDGGVEIECIPTYKHNFSLSGKEFIKTSSSHSGKSSKICKPYSLCLPKTYVTRRGQMVLFTAPEDMIIGKGYEVQKSHIEDVSQSAARQLKTTNKLFSSALTFDTEKDSGISDGEGEVSPKPGCFTSVYLDKLKDMKIERSLQVTDEEEDIEGGGTNLPITGSDSGFDSSSHQTLMTSGRLSALSHHSDASTLNIVIPDGQSDYSIEHERPLTHVRFSDEVFNQDSIDRLNKEADKITNNITVDESKDDKTVTSNELADIMFALSSSRNTKVSSSKASGKSTKKRVAPVKQTKKRAIPKDKTNDSNNSHENGQCVVTEKGTATKKKSKVKKKWKKQKDLSKEETSEMKDSVPVTAYQLAESLTETEIEEITNKTESTDVQNHVNLKEQRRALQSARADERRREIEKKRAEKRELEILKKKEEEKQAILTEQITSLSQEQELKEDNTDDTSVDETESDHVIDEMQSRLQRLESVSHQPTMMLEFNGQQLERQLTQSEIKAQEAVKRARELREHIRQEETRKQKEMEEKEKEIALEKERQRHIEEQKKLSEETKREMAVKEAGKLHAKEDMNYKMHLELLTQNHTQKMSSSHVFSYFRYFPTPAKQTKKDKKRSRTTRKR